MAYLLLEELPPHVSVPRALLTRLRGPYLGQWAHTERLRLHLVQLARILGDEREKFLLLKGLSQSTRFHGRYDCRATGSGLMYNTYLVVTLAGGSRLRVRVGSRLPNPAACIDQIVQSFSQCGGDVGMNHANVKRRSTNRSSQRIAAGHTTANLGVGAAVQPSLGARRFPRKVATSVAHCDSSEIDPSRHS